MSDQDTATTDAPETAEVEEQPTQDQPADEPQEGADPASLQEVDREEAFSWSPDEARRKISKINNEIRATKRKLEEAQEAPKAVKAAESRIADLEKQTLRYEVAFDLGLPKQIAARLQGNTREEMLADAEQLLELVAPAKRPPSNRPAENLRGGGEPEKEPEETDLSKLGERMFRR